MLGIAARKCVAQLSPFWTSTTLHQEAAPMRPETSGQSEMYGEHFYLDKGKRSLQSARRYLSHLWTTFQPKSVLDVGCGRGDWLKACHEVGATRLLGLDGTWNSQTLMVDDAIEFRSTDLNKPFSVERVELAICLEVAEHLEPGNAHQLIKCLTDSSDVVLFSAAYLDQGGTNHINEQPHTYWANLFAEHFFSPFDLFRPIFWGDDDVDFWYQQNVFLYVKKDSAEWHLMTRAGHKPMANVDFMNCIHPDAMSFRRHLTALYPSFVRGLRRRLSRMNER
jgi:SAM-dependent methyltransferase